MCARTVRRGGSIAASWVRTAPAVLPTGAACDGRTPSPGSHLAVAPRGARPAMSPARWADGPPAFPAPARAVAYGLESAGLSTSRSACGPASPDRSLRLCPHGGLGCRRRLQGLRTSRSACGSVAPGVRIPWVRSNGGPAARLRVSRAPQDAQVDASWLARPLRLRSRGGVRFGGPTGLRIWRSVERAGGRFRPLRLRSRGGVRFGGPTGLRAWRSVERAGGRFLARSPPAAAPARWCAARRAHRASDLAVGLRPGGPTGLRTSPSVCGPASRGVRAPAVAPVRRTGGAWPEARRRAFLHRRPPRRGRPAASPGRPRALPAVLPREYV